MLFLLCGKFVWVHQCAHEAVHVDGVVPIVVLVGGVMNGVVARSHDGGNPVSPERSSFVLQLLHNYNRWQCDRRLIMHKIAASCSDAVQAAMLRAKPGN